MWKRLVAVGVVVLLCSTVLSPVVGAGSAQVSGEEVRVPDEDAVVVDIVPWSTDTVTLFLPVRNTGAPVERASRLSAKAGVPVYDIEIQQVDAAFTQRVNGQLVEGGKLYRTEITTDIDRRTGPLEGETVEGLTEIAPTQSPTFFVDVPAGIGVQPAETESRSLLAQRYELSSPASVDGPVTYRYPTSTLAVLAAVLLVSTLGSYGYYRNRARSVEDLDRPLTERVHEVRQAKSNAALFVPLVPAAAAVWFGSVSLVLLVATGILQSLPSGEWRTVTVWFVALAPFVRFPVLGATLALEPVYRDLAETEYRLDQVVTEWAKKTVFHGFWYWLGAVVLVTFASSIREIPPLGGALVTLVLLVRQALSPVLARGFDQTQPVPDDLREDVLDFCTREDVGVRGVSVLDTGNDVQADGFLTGVPGYRWLFLTDDLVAELDREQIRVIVARELGRVKHRHLFVRAGFAMGYWSLAFAAYAFVVTNLATLVVALVVYRLLLDWLSQRHELAADEYAATVTSHERVAETLDLLASVNLVPRDANLSPIEARIERLREDTEPAGEAPTDGHDERQTTPDE